MVSRGVSIGLGVTFGIIALFGGLFAYSYSQVRLQLTEISIAGIDWSPASAGTVISLAGNVLAGNVLGAGLALVEGLNFNFIFAASNAGFLPVEIPELSYDLYINDVNVGRGINIVNTAINPGEIKSLPVLQQVKKVSVIPAVASIIDTGGILNIKATGIAQFKFLGIPIPVPFESTKQISIVDELKKRFSDSDSGRTTTYLSMSSSTNSVSAGEIVQFSGTLLDANNNPVSNSVIFIQDEDLGSADEHLESAMTDGTGRFTATWTAQDTDFFGNKIAAFASFRGSGTYGESRSPVEVITVLASEPAPSIQKSDTRVSLQSSTNSAYLGDTVTFTGRLTTSAGEGVPNALVYVKDDDTGSGDDILGSIITRSDGSFTFVWIAEQGDPFDSLTEVYAVFEGSTHYSSSRSSTIEITVLEQAPATPPPQQFQLTTISMRVSTANPDAGDTVLISGSLLTTGGDTVSGAAIYIKDEDLGSGDDDIAVAYTDSNGYYSYSWSARKMDPLDSVVELYTVFEGTSNFGDARSAPINVTVG